MYGMKNALEEALWRTMEERALTSVCPSDTLFELSPLGPGSLDNSLFPARRSVAAGVPGRSTGSGARRDDGAPALSSFGPDLLTGGPKCNSSQPTAPENPTSLEKPSDMPEYCGGYDGGCRVFLWGEWFGGSESESEEFFAHLAYSKRRSFEASQQDDDQKTYITLDNSPWLMLPKGDNGGLKFTYQLQRGGVTLQIHQNPRRNGPVVGVVYGYEALFNRDLKEVHEEILTFLYSIGFSPTKEKLSRVDINVTLACPFDWVAEAFLNNRIVTRIKSWKQYGNNVGTSFKLETLTGGSDLQICIYDKMRELLVKQNDRKFEDLRPLLSSESVPALTRVEFRFKGESFNVFNITTVRDFTAKIADVVEYCVSKWFRVLDGSKVRGMETRQRLAREWVWVQYAFYMSLCGGRRSSTPLKRNGVQKIEKSKLLVQAFGCVSSAVAYCLELVRPLSLKEYVAKCHELVELFAPFSYDDYQKKKAFFNVRRGLRSDWAEESSAATERARFPVSEGVPF